MKTYHVTYYYCATGMEGRADTRDHGLIQANSEQDAIEQLGKRLYPKSDKLTQTWGLMAKEIINSDLTLSRINDIIDL